MHAHGCEDDKNKFKLRARGSFSFVFSFPHHRHHHTKNARGPCNCNIAALSRYRDQIGRATELNLAIVNLARWASRYLSRSNLAEEKESRATEIVVVVFVVVVMVMVREVIGRRLTATEYRLIKELHRPRD